MKKFVSCLLVLALGAGLIACSSETASEQSAVEPPQEIMVDSSVVQEAVSTTSIPIVESEIEMEPEVELEPRGDTDFRMGQWGDSMETVKQYETAEFYDADRGNSLVYLDKLAGLDTLVMYIFTAEDELYNGLYGIQNSHTNETMYITDYDKLKESLIEKYGEPFEDTILELSRLAAHADEGSALKLGYVAYRTQWETETTNILMGMNADNYKIETVISYTSKEIVPAADTDGF